MCFDISVFRLIVLYQLNSFATAQKNNRDIEQKQSTVTFKTSMGMSISYEFFTCWFSVQSVFASAYHMSIDNFPKLKIDQHLVNIPTVATLSFLVIDFYKIRRSEFTKNMCPQHRHVQISLWRHKRLRIETLRHSNSCTYSPTQVLKVS